MTEEKCLTLLYWQDVVPFLYPFDYIGAKYDLWWSYESECLFKQPLQQIHNYSYYTLRHIGDIIAQVSRF